MSGTRDPGWFAATLAEKGARYFAEHKDDAAERAQRLRQNVTRDTADHCSVELVCMVLEHAAVIPLDKANEQLRELYRHAIFSIMRLVCAKGISRGTYFRAWDKAMETLAHHGDTGFFGLANPPDMLNFPYNTPDLDVSAETLVRLALVYAQSAFPSTDARVRRDVRILAHIAGELTLSKFHALKQQYIDFDQVMANYYKSNESAT